MSIKTPRLIRDRCGVYYFRLLVPLALRESVGKTEYRRSLKTKDSVIARQRALSLCVVVEAIMAGPKPNISDFTHLFGEGSSVRKVMTIDHERGYYHADTPEEARTLAGIVENLAVIRKAAHSEAVAALPSSTSGVNLQTTQEKFFRERGATLKASTLLKHRGVVRGFIAQAGNLDVSRVTHQTVNDYKQSLLEAKRSASTINDHISILRGFFAYCISNKIARMENPAEGLNIVGGRNQVKPYKPFTLAELKKIFAPTHYLKAMKTPDFYWGPLVALFTGARAEEIASLHLLRILREDGITYIEINEGKTENARRKIPVHDQLIALGFLDYVETMKKAGYSMLFPHLQDGKNGYKKNMCRRFGEYLDSPGVQIIDELKVFHSFRHTVITKLTDAGVNEGLKRKMVGHEMDTTLTAHDGYIHQSDLTISSLHREMNKLRYDGIRFDDLKVAPEVFLKIVERKIAQRTARLTK